MVYDKIVFIDVDGTLTSGLSSWERVHHYFKKYDSKMVEKMDANTALWELGEIDYDTWAKMDVALWKNKPYKDLTQALLPPNLIKGAKEGVDILRKNGFYIVLVSGGINVMVDEVKRLIGADEAYSNIICEENGIINGEVKVPVGNTKVGIVESVIKSHDIDIKNTYAVGDHLNDTEMFDFVNYSIGVNIKREQLRDKVDVVMETDTFVDVANIILSKS